MIRPRWYIPAGLLAALGALILGVAIFGGSDSPRDFVANRYTRAATRDIDGTARAYTSSRTPTLVADEIAQEWRPADRYVDGSGVYLRYADDVVSVLPSGAGSLILVENIRTAYARYFGTVGGYWGWNTRSGEGVRGGGPGAGK